MQPVKRFVICKEPAKAAFLLTIKNFKPTSKILNLLEWTV